MANELNPSAVRKWATTRDRVQLWAFGTIAASLIPPFFAVVIHGVDRKSPLSIAELFGRGELLIIGIVITIGAFSGLLPVIKYVREDDARPMVFALLGGFMLTVAEALWYADLTAAILDRSDPPFTVVAVGSWICFVSSSICSCFYIKFASDAE